MDDTPANKKYDWPIIILAALLMLGAVVALYDAFLREHTRQRILMGEIVRLEQQLATMEKKTDDSETQAALAQLTGRLAMLEKTAQAPAPIITWQNSSAGETLQRYAALQQAISAGTPYAAQLAPLHDLPQLAPVLAVLQAHAEQGVTSEEKLRAQLDVLLNAQPATAPVAQDAQLAKLNERLKGLITIQHTPQPMTDAYATLRAEAQAQASLPLLIHSAQALDDAARAPLAAWLDAATARQTVLDDLTAAFATPKPAA